MALSLPQGLYNLLYQEVQAHDLDVYLAAALINRESGWNPNAMGDREPLSDEEAATLNAIPAEAPGTYFMAYGLGQLHLRGAGSGRSPADLLDPATNLSIAFAFLRNLVVATPTLEDALSAYNQGLGGWQARGILDSQRPYIADIMALAADYRATGIIPFGEGAAPEPVETPPSPPGPPRPGVITFRITEITLKGELIPPLP